MSRDEARATCGESLARLISQAAVRFMIRTCEENLGHFDLWGRLVLVYLVRVPEGFVYLGRALM